MVPEDELVKLESLFLDELEPSGTLTLLMKKLSQKKFSWIRPQKDSVCRTGIIRVIRIVPRLIQN